ncbi:MAG TPA: cyclic nucleotide-binding domain-containing protein [Actinomycetota bacterium]|jgi:CRP-like cAMP-binding protein|nr:cyclic nucleotide-binding domain-containing protein [Actinomycetota bacterium]
MSQGAADMLGRGGGRLGTPLPEQLPRRTVRQNAQSLAAVPLFAGFSAKHLKRLASQSDELSFEPREPIVEEGMLGETLFVVLNGRGKVTRRGRKVGEVLPGDFFGELSTLDGGPRSATVMAETPMRVLRLFRHTLRDLLREEPSLTLKLLDGIVRRMREVQRDGGDLRD